MSEGRVLKLRVLKMYSRCRWSHLETFPSQDGEMSSQIGNLESISGRLKTSNASQVCSGGVPRWWHLEMDERVLSWVRLKMGFAS
eukprot:3534511-Prymnesium_polylepis.1